MTAYLIGGASRCGKSTLFRRMRAQRGSQALELDLLKPAIVAWARPFPQDPLLTAPSVIDHEPGPWLEKIRDRDRVIWDGLVPFLRAAQSEGEDVLLEGCLWPDHVAELRGAGIEHRAVFMVDNGAEHANRLVSTARGKMTSNNWQSDWPEVKLRRWAGFNRFRSVEIARQARHHRYVAPDVNGWSLDWAQDRAAQELLRDAGRGSECGPGAP